MVGLQLAEFAITRLDVLVCQSQYVALLFDIFDPLFRVRAFFVAVGLGSEVQLRRGSRAIIAHVCLLGCILVRSVRKGRP